MKLVSAHPEKLHSVRVFFTAFVYLSLDLYFILWQQRICFSFVPFVERKAKRMREKKIVVVFEYLFKEKMYLLGVG